MKWISKYIDADPLRVQKADIKAPLLVTEWKGKIVPVDGAHRLTKALQTGVDKLPVRRILGEELEKCLVHS